VAVHWEGGGVLLALGRPSLRRTGTVSLTPLGALATDVRAARQPGTMAVRMARARVDVATVATVTIEVAGCGTT
jgi:hypothetical protein